MDNGVYVSIPQFTFGLSASVTQLNDYYNAYGSVDNESKDRSCPVLFLPLLINQS